MNTNNPDTPNAEAVSRRQFLKKTTTVAGGSVLGMGLVGCASTKPKAAATPSIGNAKNNQSFNAIIIGLGGRGSGAGGNFLEAAKFVGVDAKIVAVADIFSDAANKAQQLFGVASDKCFSGFDAYMKALEVPGVNYVIIATPPGFRPPFFKAAVDANKHVFCEKPVAVDGPGARIMYAAAEESKKKGLKVAAGTQRRHRPSYQETIKRIQDGQIGDVTALRAYWVNGGPIWHRGMHGDTDLERQIHNWYHYIWLCGDHICEQHIHNLDVCNWVAGAHPVKAWGMGARQQLGDKPGEIWDNFAVEFEYPNGNRIASYCCQIKRGWSSVSEAVVGAKGEALMIDGRNSIKTKDGKNWRTPRDLPRDNGYVNEHVDLINAIIHETPLNEAKQVTDSTLTCIVGREAAYSGSVVEWDEMLNSDFHYGPPLVYTNPAKMTWGPFRTLQPPMPGSHDIFAKPPEVPTV